MAKLKRSVIIHALPEKVFIFVNDRAILPEMWPGRLELRDIQALYSGGHRYTWTYRIAGRRVEGTSETTEFIPNKRIVDKTVKGVPSTFIWSFEPQNNGTKLTLEIEYLITTPVLGMIVEAFLIRTNERQAGICLANMKAKMEVLTII
jgi:ribosome-associated toxin RatA of RatAB toxin-antitoxin module